MSASGRPLADGITIGWEWLVTEKELSRETVMRWALSVHHSTKLVVARRNNQVNTKFAGSFENIVIEATVYDSQNRQVDSKKWKTKALAADLEKLFEGRLTYETVLNI